MRIRPRLRSPRVGNGEAGEEGRRRQEKSGPIEVRQRSTVDLLDRGEAGRFAEMSPWLRWQKQKQKQRQRQKRTRQDVLQLLAVPRGDTYSAKDRGAPRPDARDMSLRFSARSSLDIDKLGPATDDPVGGIIESCGNERKDSKLTTRPDELSSIFLSRPSEL
ncbi:hypothetical protein VTN02DRAFT_1684 [Thermoascus thermophilus]